MNSIIRHLLICLFTVLTAAQVGYADEVVLDHDTLESEFHSQLHQLAEKCEELKLDTQAQQRKSRGSTPHSWLPPSLRQVETSWRNNSQ